MTLIQAILKATSDPSTQDDLPTAYLAGYQDAHIEMRQRLRLALQECDDHLYVMAPFERGYTFTRVSLRTLDVDPPASVSAPVPDAAPPDPDSPF